MIYKHKYLLTIAVGMLIIIAGYIFDIHPLRIQLSELHQSEIMLHEKLAAMKALPQDLSALKQSHEINGINNLVSFIHASGLDISKIKQENTTGLHVDLTGNYQQFLAFMSGLREKPDVLSLKNISCVWTKNNYLQIGMDIFLMGNPEFLHYVPSQHLQNPFCTSSNMNSWFNQRDESELLLFPLSQIKMAGFLQMGEKRAGLLVLPNKMTVMVEAGDLVGAEKARVLSISRDQVFVRLRGGEEKFIAAD